MSNRPTQVVTLCAECGGFRSVRSGYPSTTPRCAVIPWTDYTDDIVMSVPADRDVHKVYGGRCTCGARPVAARGAVSRELEVDDAA